MASEAPYNLRSQPPPESLCSGHTGPLFVKHSKPILSHWLFLETWFSQIITCLTLSYSKSASASLPEISLS